MSQEPEVLERVTTPRGELVLRRDGELYRDEGTAVIAARLNADGILSVWSASRAPGYEAVLGRYFSSVQTHDIMVGRGEPDVVMVASGPRGVRERDGNCDCS
jgi:hypothetical protein